MIKKLWQIAYEAGSGFFTNRLSTAAAAMAFYTMFALGPILIFVIAVAEPFVGKLMAQQALFDAMGTIVDQKHLKTIQRFATDQVNPVVVGGAVSSGWDAMGFYEYWSAPLTFAEYTTEEDKFVGETVLWALPDDKAMWAMRTTTRRTDPGAFADDIAAAVAADLRRAGIVPE